MAQKKIAALAADELRSPPTPVTLECAEAREDGEQPYLGCDEEIFAWSLDGGDVANLHDRDRACSYPG
jgi:hypothetical protein